MRPDNRLYDPSEDNLSAFRYFPPEFEGLVTIPEGFNDFFKEG